MLVLIDESGDPGFKNASSRYFIITMVVFPTHTDDGRYPEAERTATVIRQTMVETHHKPEFHFTKCAQDIRTAFFKALNAAGCEFMVFALVVDKKNIISSHLKKKPKDFYNFLLKQLLSHSPIINATIKIDGRKNKQFIRALKAYLRSGNQGMIQKLKFVDSHKDALIQLADMVCGAISYTINRSDRLHASMFQDMLGKRIRDIWDFK